MSSGNKAIREWLRIAKGQGQNMRVAQEWDKGRPIGYAIWFYKPGEMEDAVVMTRASTLDLLQDPETPSQDSLL